MRIEQLFLLGLVGPFGVALVLSVLLTRVTLSLVRRGRLGQQVREDGPESHLTKQGTPSLGGLALLTTLTLVAAAILVKAGWNVKAIAPICLALLYGALGLWDDLSKIRAGNTRGIKARWRLLAEFLLAFGALWWIVATEYPGPAAPYPRFWGFSALAVSSDPTLQILWVLLGGFVVVAAANAVNLTDGVDGLAASVTIPCALGLGCAFFFRGMGDLAILAAATGGAALGFLWFNAHPAKIFMGDVGSLALGGLLGMLAVAGGAEWLFGILAVVFVIEALTVILQVSSFKLTGKRLFRMTPIHHAFELKGWSEPQVATRFALMGAAAMCIALTVFILVGKG
jgi:phospho-N-acetylmuramoyl-pentapeptide-transferase